MADAPTVEFSSEITELADKLVNLTIKDAQTLVDCMKDVHGIEPAGGAVVMAGGGGEEEERDLAYAARKRADESALKADSSAAAAKRERNLANKSAQIAQEQTLAANYNLAKMFEEKAGAAFEDARASRSNRDYQKAWLYTLAALQLPFHEDSVLSNSNGRLLNCPRRMAAL